MSHVTPPLLHPASALREPGMRGMDTERTTRLGQKNVLGVSANGPASTGTAPHGASGAVDRPECEQWVPAHEQSIDDSHSRCTVILEQ